MAPALAARLNPERCHYLTGVASCTYRPPLDLFPLTLSLSKCRNRYFQGTTSPLISDRWRPHGMPLSRLLVGMGHL